MFTLSGWLIATKIRKEGQKASSTTYLKKKQSELERIKVNETRKDVSEVRKAIQRITSPVKRFINTVIPQQVLTPVKKVAAAIHSKVNSVVSSYNKLLVERYIKRPIGKVTNYIKRWLRR